MAVVHRRESRLKQRALELESKLDATTTEAGQLMKRADRHETATSTLQVRRSAAAAQTGWSSEQPTLLGTDQH